MNGPRITNEDRGITLNKQLAWVITVGLICAGLWLGSEVVGTKNMVLDIRASQIRQDEDRAQYRRDVDQRLRALENARATDGSELSALRRDLTSFRAEIREDITDLKDLLRETQQTGDTRQ
jgi:hypothetical protein